MAEGFIPINIFFSFLFTLFLYFSFYLFAFSIYLKIGQYPSIFNHLSRKLGLQLSSKN